MAAQVLFALVGFGFSDQPCQPLPVNASHQAAAQQIAGNSQRRAVIKCAIKHRQSVI